MHQRDKQVPRRIRPDLGPLQDLLRILQEFRKATDLRGPVYKKRCFAKSIGRLQTLAIGSQAFLDRIPGELRQKKLIQRSESDLPTFIENVMVLVVGYNHSEFGDFVQLVHHAKRDGWKQQDYHWKQRLGQLDGVIAVLLEWIHMAGQMMDESIKKELPRDLIEPDGFVPNPVDLTGFVLPTQLDWGPIRFDKQLKWLRDYPNNRVRWTRPRSKSGNIISNRLLVHAADHANRMKSLHSDPSPSEISKRSREIRLGK